MLGLADRILEVLQTPFLLDGHELVVTASIGIALGGADVESAEEVVRNADIAMYQAKSRGKAGYVVFDEAMHAEAVARLQLDTDLRQADEPARIADPLPADRVASNRQDHGASRPCCGGTTRTAAWSTRTSSSRWRKRPS